jgi:hypothetical protein
MSEALIALLLGQSVGILCVSYVMTRRKHASSYPYVTTSPITSSPTTLASPVAPAPPVATTPPVDPAAPVATATPVVTATAHDPRIPSDEEVEKWVKALLTTILPSPPEYVDVNEYNLDAYILKYILKDDIDTNEIMKIIGAENKYSQDEILNSLRSAKEDDAISKIFSQSLKVVKNIRISSESSSSESILLPYLNDDDIEDLIKLASEHFTTFETDLFIPIKQYMLHVFDYWAKSIRLSRAPK